MISNSTLAVVVLARAARESNFASEPIAQRRSMHPTIRQRRVLSLRESAGVHDRRRSPEPVNLLEAILEVVQYEKTDRTADQNKDGKERGERRARERFVSSRVEEEKAAQW